MDILIKELKKMATKKLITKEMLELLLKFPDDKLQQLCATFMNDILFLTYDELLELYESCDNSRKFNAVLKKIKKDISGYDNFNIFKQNIIYLFAKFFGFLEYSKEKQQSEMVKFLFTYIFIPSLKILARDENVKPLVNMLFDELEQLL